jgi:hypothetical protein
LVYPKCTYTSELFYERRSVVVREVPLAKARWVVETWALDLLGEIEGMAKDFLQRWERR